MNYTIISINDDRAEYKRMIRERTAFPEVVVPAFNARENDPIAELARRDLRVNNEYQWYPSRGELGIWLSVINAWEYAADSGETLVVFEDDAIPDPNFGEMVKYYCEELPGDWDYMALWVPENQKQDYYYNVTYDENGYPSIRGTLPEEQSLFRMEHPKLAKVYQGYGGVALMYSPAGAAKFLDLIRKQGLWSTSDCYLYLAAHAGWVNGYAPHPNVEMPVHYDWSATTTIHDTEIL